MYSVLYICFFVFCSMYLCLFFFLFYVFTLIFVFVLCICFYSLFFYILFFPSCTLFMHIWPPRKERIRDIQATSNNTHKQNDNDPVYVHAAKKKPSHRIIPIFSSPKLTLNSPSNSWWIFGGRSEGRHDNPDRPRCRSFSSPCQAPHASHAGGSEG